MEENIKYIQEHWTELMSIMRNLYDISNIVMETWVEPIKIYKTDNKTIYFKVPEQRGPYAVTYLQKKKLDQILCTILQTALKDPAINIVIEYIETKKSPEAERKDEEEQQRTFKELAQLKKLAKGRYNYLAFSSNDFIRNAMYSLKEEQFLMLLYMVSKVKPPYELVDGVEVSIEEQQKTFEFTVQEYCRTMRIPFENQGGQVYDQVKATIKAIADSSWWKYKEPSESEEANPSKGLKLELFRFIMDVETDEKIGTIKYTWTEDMIPHLYNLKRNFTAVEPSQVSFLDGDYAGRIYHLSMSYLYRGGFSISVEKLKIFLGIHKMKSYKEFKEFRRAILDPSIKRINENTNIDLLMETDGRPVETLYFTAIEKNGDRLQAISEQHRLSYQQYDQQEEKNKEKKQNDRQKRDQKKKNLKDPQMSIMDYLDMLDDGRPLQLLSEDKINQTL